MSSNVTGRPSFLTFSVTKKIGERPSGNVAFHYLVAQGKNMKLGGLRQVSIICGTCCSYSFYIYRYPQAIRSLNYACLLRHSLVELLFSVIVETSDMGTEEKNKKTGRKRDSF